MHLDFSEFHKFTQVILLPWNSLFLVTIPNPFSLQGTLELHLLLNLNLISLTTNGQSSFWSYRLLFFNII